MPKNAPKIYKKSISPSRRAPAAMPKVKAGAPTPPVNDAEDDLKQALVLLGGSKSDDWNNALANQILDCVWVRDPDDEAKAVRLFGIYSFVVNQRTGVGEQARVTLRASQKWIIGLAQSISRKYLSDLVPTSYDQTSCWGVWRCLHLGRYY